MPDRATDAPGAPDGGEKRLGLIVRALQAFTGPWTWQNFAGWIAILAIIFFVKGCVVDQYTIPSGSMEPTLRGDPRFFRGDRVLVNKWLFGPRIPFTTIRLAKWGEPKRWDIVVFHAIDPDAAHPILIKRVVGLPGEKVLIRNGRITVNGEVVEPPGDLAERLYYTSEFTLDDVDRKRQFLFLARGNKQLTALNPLNPQVQTLYAEMARIHPLVRDADVAALTDDAIASLCANVNGDALAMMDSLFAVVRPNMHYGITDEPAYTQIPDGHYFMLGDNSAQSLDGRSYGWVPHNHLYGRTFAVWWPWPRRQDFTGFSRTWWGMLLIYGIPATFIALELYFSLRRKRAA